MSEKPFCKCCGRYRLPLFTLRESSDAEGKETLCYPCMGLNGHPLIGLLFVSPEKVEPKKGWGYRQLKDLTWEQIVAFARTDEVFDLSFIIEPGNR